MATYLNGNEISIVTLGDNVELDRLTTRINKLETELAVYTVKVLVTVQDTIKEYYVEKGKKLSLEDPYIEGYNFKGWNINDQVIDLNTYNFNIDTSIHAVLTKIEWICNLDDFSINDGTIMKYNGNDDYVELPSSYSLEAKDVAQNGVLIKVSNLPKDFEELNIRTINGTQYTFTDSYMDIELQSTDKIYLESVTVRDSYLLSSLHYSVSYPVICNDTVFSDENTFREYIDGSWDTTTFNFICTAEMDVPVVGNDYTITGLDFYALQDQSFIGIKIPATIVSMNSGHGILNGCANLEKIIIDPNHPTFDSRDNCNAIIETATNYLITGCLGTIIPEGIVRIEQSAFFRVGIENITLPHSLTYIRTGAFNGCSKLRSIYIPENVRTIESSVFYDCSAVTSIQVDVNNTKYDSRNNCNAIIETSTNKLLRGCINTIIPNTVVKLDQFAFQGMPFETFTIPNSVTTLSWRAFSNCPNLTHITIPESVTSLGEWTFRDCPVLKTVQINGNITSIDKGCFYNCPNLEFPELPETVTSIGDSAFDSCLGIIELNIPSGITTIGSYAFQDCTNLIKVIIPDSIIEIGSGAFRDCENLKTVINYSNLYIGKNTQNGYAGYYATNITNANADIEDGIAYSNRTILMGIEDYTKSTYNLREGVTEIPANFFEDCTSLVNIVLPEGITKVGNYAFRGCDLLLSIDFPSTVTSLGSNVTTWCYDLETLIFRSINPPTIPNYSTINLADKIYVPAESVDTYKAATNWSRLASKIYAIEEN